MFRFWTFLSLTTAFAGIAGLTAAHAADLLVSPAEQQTIDASASVSITIEALALKRWTDDTPLAYIDDYGVALSTDDLAEDYAPGLRASLSWVLGDGWGAKLTGFYAGGSGAGEVISGSQDLFAAYSAYSTPSNIYFGNSEDAYSMNAEQQWTLAGVEVSGTYDLGPQVKLTAGPAWLHYANSLDTRVLDEDGTPSYIDDVSISSTNELYGGVVGLEAQLPISDAISVGGRIAGGVYLAHKVLDRTYNAAGGSSSPFNSNLEQDSSSTDEVATSIEFSPKVALAISSNLSLSLGGTFLWLNGVDEAASHFRSIGADDSSGNLAAEDPVSTSVQFGGVTLGLTGTF